MWANEKAGYLKDSRDYSQLLDDRSDRAELQDLELSKDRQEYLRRRQKIKELLKNKSTFVERSRNEPSSSNRDTTPKRRDPSRAFASNKNDSSSSKRDSAPQESRRALPYDRTFGSFFGPSEPVVAKRILEEARNRDEAAIVAARLAKQAKQAKQGDRRIGNASSSKPVPKPSKPMRPPTKTKLKAQKLKEARDYSFLFSENGDSAPQSKPPNTGKSANGNARDGYTKAPVSSRSLKEPFRSTNTTSKSSSRPVPSQTSRLPPKTTPRPAAAQKSNPADSRSATRAAVEKRPPEQGVKRKIDSQRQTSHMDRSQQRISGASRHLEANKQKSNSDRIRQGDVRHIDTSKQRASEAAGTNKQKFLSDASRRLSNSADRVVSSSVKQKLQSSSKPQGKPNLPKAKISEMKRPEQSQSRRFQKDGSPDSFVDDDDEDANYRSFLPKMFRLDSRRYADDDGYDSSDMEVGFSTIQAEEARSARIAREEDERERLLIEEEERQERLKKKRRKA